MKKTVGINPELIMRGNYARVVFDEANKANILSIIPDEDGKKHLSSVLTKFRLMRKVYRAKDPKKEYPDTGCPVFLVFPSFLDCPLLFPSFL